MNLIIGETREIINSALLDINNWTKSDGSKVFPMGATLCWYREENIIELIDGRFAIPTVPNSTLIENQIVVGDWFERFDVIQIDNAESLIPNIDVSFK